ncbi:MAG: hypothetical protein QNI89_17370 [Desulfobacterales bacterium]|nr:hypothetical protein [Desulfobacterales bacterium]MDJ0889078.1 hypothetical protein [Desulfobacterales bacterium]
MRGNFIIGVLFLGIVAMSSPLLYAADHQCPPTAPDMQGPFYKPGAPLRDTVGKGYLLTGTVKSAADCDAIAKAAIEFWMASPEGEYDDAHRATVVSDDSGNYRFESHPPPAYAFRPPHIHLRVTAAGFKTLVTQHYPQANKAEASFDIVLVPGD